MLDVKKRWFVTSSLFPQMKWLAWGFFADMGKIQSCGPLKRTICCLASHIYKDMLISFCTTLFWLMTCRTGRVLSVMWSLYLLEYLIFYERIMNKN